MILILIIPNLINHSYDEWVYNFTYRLWTKQGRIESTCSSMPWFSLSTSHADCPGWWKCHDPAHRRKKVAATRPENFFSSCEPTKRRRGSSAVSSPTCTCTSLMWGPQRPGAGMQAISSSPLCGHWRIRRHWLAARITALSALGTLTCGRTAPSSSARRLCSSSTYQRLALWTTSSTGRRGVRWGRSRPSSWSTAP